MEMDNIIYFGSALLHSTSDNEMIKKEIRVYI
jgi:hypothetical protein